MRFAGDKNIFGILLASMSILTYIIYVSNGAGEMKGRKMKIELQTDGINWVSLESECEKLRTAGYAANRAMDASDPADCDLCAVPARGWDKAEARNEEYRKTARDCRLCLRDGLDLHVRINGAARMILRKSDRNISVSVAMDGNWSPWADPSDIMRAESEWRGEGGDSERRYAMVADALRALRPHLMILIGDSAASLDMNAPKWQ